MIDELSDSDKQKVVTELLTARFAMVVQNSGDMYNVWLQMAEHILYNVAPELKQVKSRIWTIAEGANIIMADVMKQAYVYDWNPLEIGRYSLVMAIRRAVGQSVSRIDLGEYDSSHDSALAQIPGITCHAQDTVMLMRDMIGVALEYVDFSWIAGIFLLGIPPQRLAESRIPVADLIEMAMPYKKEVIKEESIELALIRADTRVMWSYQNDDVRDIATKIVRCLAGLVEGKIHPGQGEAAEELHSTIVARLERDPLWHEA